MLISKQKLNKLVTSIKTNCITILQGPPGCLKTSTLTSQFHTFYIENYKRFGKHFNSDILRTDIDNKKDLIDFITRFKGHKIIIETRCTISNTELEIIRTKTEVSVELVTFNALSDIKLKKLGGDSKLHNNIHNLKYNMENVQIISFYHFLGKLFYKNVELNYLEYYEPSKVLDYVRQNFVYFMDDLYVIELMSENCVYVTEIVVLYINQAEKKRPNKFFGFSSLENEERGSKKFLYF